MPAVNLTVTATLVTLECCSCGIEFAVRQSFETRLRDTHKQFYCPNGHPQSFVAKSEAEQLREKLAEAERVRDLAVKRKEWAEQETKRAEEERDRLKKRVARGSCPCCKRHFKNLERHMASKHPTEIKPAKGS
jgi:hypothetical protein